MNPNNCHERMVAGRTKTTWALELMRQAKIALVVQPGEEGIEDEDQVALHNNCHRLLAHHLTALQLPPMSPNI